MKTKMIFFFIGFLFSLPVSQAQIGVRIGLNLASMSVKFDDESLNTKMKTGFGAGIFYHHVVNEKFSIQPELNYMQMGTKFEEDGEEGTLSLSYIHLPVLAKYSFGNTEALHFYAQGGPFIGYGIGKVKSEYCYDGECEEEELDYDSTGEEGPKPLDIGLQIGVGAMINSNISVDARYIHGFQNLSNEEEEGSIKNYSFFVSVGYRF